MTDSSGPGGAGARYFGLYTAIVADVVDPDEHGRIRVELPDLGGAAEGGSGVWATLVTPYAGDGQGFLFLPEVGSRVVVGFEAGDLHRPYVVGGFWGDTGAIPETSATARDVRLIHTRAGSRIELDDSPGAAKITVSTASGHRLVLDEGGSSIRAEHSGGSMVVLDGARIEVRSAGTVTVRAGAVRVHAPIASFDGVVTCATLVASSGVVSPSYTPGLGNLL